MGAGPGRAEACRAAAQVRCGRRVKAGSAGKNCPGGSLSPFQSPARDPTATPCRVPAGQGAGRCPCRTAARGGASRAPAQRAPLSSASTQVRRRVRSSFRTGAGGGRSAQALLPRTPHGRPCRHGEDGRRWRIPLPRPLPRLAMASSHCGGAWPRPAPGRVRAPQGRASWSRSANWEDGRPSASSPS